MSLERNIGKEDEFRVSGGSEFQSRGPMTEKALLSRDDRTYGMERTSESENLVETECLNVTEMKDYNCLPFTVYRLPFFQPRQLVDGKKREKAQSA